MKKVTSLLALMLLLLFSVAPNGGKPIAPMGPLSQITLATNDLDASINFWKKLGFRVTLSMKTPQPWTQMTDETILIYLVQDPAGFQRLSYFTADYEGTLKRMAKSKIKPERLENDEAGKPWRAIFKSPDNFEFSLVNRNPQMLFHPQGKTMLTMDQADMMNPDKMPAQMGMFGEFCHKVTDLDKSIAYWEKLGFKNTGKNTEPYPWAVMSDGVSLVGLHQTTDWDGCAITYFAPNMGPRIEKLKTLGIEGKEMGMGPDNVVVTSPEGAKLFLFSMGM